jgi:hypothetical protein
MLTNEVLTLWLDSCKQKPYATRLFKSYGFIIQGDKK